MSQWYDIMADKPYDVTSERLAQLKEQASRCSVGQSSAGLQPAAACAHLTIGYVRQYLGAGKERGWWQCTECERKFVPVGTGPA